MGGVDLWHKKNEGSDNFDPQSKHDKRLDVVSISATWHLGKLQVIILSQSSFSFPNICSKLSNYDTLLILFENFYIHTY